MKVCFSEFSENLPNQDICIFVKNNVFVHVHDIANFMKGNRVQDEVNVWVDSSIIILAEMWGTVGKTWV